MTSSNFIDQIKLYFKSGKGGPGLVHFMRAKFIPKGGPDGGDGGRGGHIFLRGNKQYHNLFHLRYRKYIKADNGQPGGQNCRTGANGKDTILDVPLGTVAKQADNEKLVIEVLENQKLYRLMKGGKGGWGNTHFKTPTQQTPHIAYPGEAGQEGWLILELKLLADVGLVGLPNVGKSTLLSVVSAAKPHIANYPFTTLTPNLGVVNYQNEHNFVMADIPGIIQGAALGKGLGTRFLRHIERNVILLFMISAETENIKQTYDMLLQELETHNPALLHKHRLLAISKIDLLDQDQKNDLFKKVPKHIPWLPISSSTGEGIQYLKNQLWKMICSSRQTTKDTT